MPPKRNIYFGSFLLLLTYAPFLSSHSAGVNAKQKRPVVWIEDGQLKANVLDADGSLNIITLSSGPVIELRLIEDPLFSVEPENFSRPLAADWGAAAAWIEISDVKAATFYGNTLF